MAEVQQHIIKKFSLELETADNGEQYKLQRRCSNLVKEKMTPAMDEIFTANFPGNSVTRISKIEIDLGNIDADKLEEIFIQECLKQLKQKIKSIANASSASEAIAIQLISEGQNILEQFFYFLETGILPLPASGNDIKEWEQNIIAAVKEQEDFFTGHFQQLIQKRHVASERLVAQFDINFINALLYAAGITGGNAISSVYEKLQLKIEAQLSVTAEKLLFAALIKTFCSLQVKDSQQFLSVITESPDALITAGDEYPKTFAQWEQLIYAFGKKDFLPQQKGEIAKAYKEITKDNNEKQIAEKKEETINVIKSAAVFIDNAGLVILHPFFETMFETLGFTQNKSFVNDASRYRALHLLQYMVNNEEATPEYILPLNKLLCGIPAEEHIERFITLNENEKKEALELLQAVISHWSALKHTSAEGLQEAFLRRRGKLSFNKTDAYWKLQVEKSAIDILLNKLPWGYSYIQLPWMQHRLVTEWQSY